MNALDIDLEMLPGIGMLVVIVVLSFLILREIFTWYWKLNRIVSLLEKIEENTSKEKTTP